MKNLTNEQIERINEIYDSLYGDLSEEELIAMYGTNAISLEDKIEDITQYYEAAGFDIGKSEENFKRFLGV